MEGGVGGGRSVAAGQSGKRRIAEKKQTGPYNELFEIM